MFILSYEDNLLNEKFYEDYEDEEMAVEQYNYLSKDITLKNVMLFRCEKMMESIPSEEKIAA